MVLFGERSYLIVGYAHGDAECFGFVASGDDASVVAGEDDDGFAFEVGSEDSLAGDKEIVAIAEGVNHVMYYLTMYNVLFMYYFCLCTI